MASIIYNDIDPVSYNTHRYFHSRFKDLDCPFKMVKSDSELINADVPENIEEPVIFASKHVSSKSIASFTVHSEGNWSSKAELGGKPKTLSASAPVEMLSVLSKMAKLKVGDIDVTYEATHHGPYTLKKSFFAEVGGNLDIIENPKMAEILAEALIQAFESDNYYKKVVVGIGGNHYSSRFTKLALEKGYAFAYIMSRYYVSEIDMLSQAFELSYPKPEIAVIEWKSLSSIERQDIIKKLNEVGVDYERI